MFHVTNGSVALSRIHDLGLGGEVVPWDDILHDGPVPGHADTAALRRLRAAFLAGPMRDRIDEVERSLAARDRALDRGAASGDEIVLWFEHDLYDQLQLLQILDRLRGAADRVTVVLADDYLSEQDDETLRAWFAARRPLTADERTAAADAWRAFTAEDPSALGAERHGSWSSLAASLERHQQQFPWLETGLSRTERQTLAALAPGPRTAREAYVASNHDVEEAVFLGDWGWLAHVFPLFVCPQPLLALDRSLPPTTSHEEWWRDDDGAPRLRLTAAGERVLAGQADHVSINGLDRWLGGVHLQGHGPLWRWNEEARRLEWR